MILTAGNLDEGLSQVGIGLCCAKKVQLNLFAGTIEYSYN